MYTLIVSIIFMYSFVETAHCYILKPYVTKAKPGVYIYYNGT